MLTVFHPAAKAEFTKAAHYYEACTAGLGKEFYHQIFAAIHIIQAFPNGCQIMEGKVRRCLVHRFPFGVLYIAMPDKIYILAIMHLNRHPDYWHNRLK